MIDLTSGRWAFNDVVSSLQYLSGFGAELESQSVPGSLPIGCNSPQMCPLGLYAEQLSGTSFTTPRASNQRTWFYRIRPSAVHSSFIPVEDENPFINWISEWGGQLALPNQIRWKPLPFPDAAKKVTFIEGITSLCGAGGPDLKTGLSIHIYSANSSMRECAFCNSDGDFLIVPDTGVLIAQTEMGVLSAGPGEILIIPRGIRFAIKVQGNVRGYICEVFTGHLKLPELGPIGANGLANARDFKYPVANYDGSATKSGQKLALFTIFQKFLGKFFTAEQDHSCFDVVAWHGNYLPFKYDLALYNAMNSVTYDHPDPSIFTVLTVPTGEPGVAALDFVIFPPRWQVQDGFRPPYFHRNAPMSEFMGNIRGEYEAKPTGFPVGAATLHSVCVPHGPSYEAYKTFSKQELTPVKLNDVLAFMFETSYILRVAPSAVSSERLDNDYQNCWAGLPAIFTEPQ